MQQLKTDAHGVKYYEVIWPPRSLRTALPTATLKVKAHRTPTPRTGSDWCYAKLLTPDYARAACYIKTISCYYLTFTGWLMSLTLLWRALALITTCRYNPANDANTLVLLVTTTAATVRQGYLWQRHPDAWQRSELLHVVPLSPPVVGNLDVTMTDKVIYVIGNKDGIRLQGLRC